MNPMEIAIAIEVLFMFGISTVQNYALLHDYYAEITCSTFIF
jgi:hypothetical protein